MGAIQSSYQLSQLNFEILDLTEKADLDLMLQHFQREFPHLKIQYLQKHDTFEITQLYLQRPQSLACMKQSQWFCEAAKIFDWELINAASLGDFKTQLLRKHYVYIPLEVLKEFNRSKS